MGSGGDVGGETRSGWLSSDTCKNHGLAPGVCPPGEFVLRSFKRRRCKLKGRCCTGFRRTLKPGAERISGWVSQQHGLEEQWIKYNSAPARGKLPYGPHGPAIIGFGEGLGKEFDKVYPDDAYNYQFDDKFDPLLWLGYNHPERDHHNDKHGRKGHKGRGYSRGGYGGYGGHGFGGYGGHGFGDYGGHGYGGGYGHFGQHDYGYGKHSDHGYDDHEDDHYGYGDDHYGHGDDHYDNDHYGYQDKYGYGDSYGHHGRYGRHRYRHYGGPFYGSYLPPYHFNSPQFPWLNAYQNVAATNNYGTGYFNQQIQPGTKYQTVGYQTNYPTSTTQNPGHYQAPVSETQYPGSQYNGGSRQDFGVPQGTYPTPQYAENHQVPLPEAQYPANQYPAPNPEPHYPAGQYNNPGAVPQGDVYPTGYQPPKVEPTQTAEVPVYQKPSPAVNWVQPGTSTDATHPPWAKPTRPPTSYVYSQFGCTTEPAIRAGYASKDARGGPAT